MFDCACSLFAPQLFRTLPAGLEPHTVAMRCRSAAVELMDGAVCGWGKVELASWIAGAYREVTRHADTVHGRAAPLSFDEPLADVREQVVLALEDAAVGRARIAFVERAIACAQVVPCVSASRECGWVPADTEGASLTDRVLALFAVDCLAEPRDYARAFLVCPRCGRIAFDPELRERGGCVAHAPATSAVVSAAPSVVTPAPSNRRRLTGTG